MRKPFLISIALLICSTAFSQIQNQKLDSLFSILNSRDLAQGSLTISSEGKVVYQNATGYSFISPAQKIPATPQTLYKIGSVSKMFTSVMIFQLAEENKIGLNQKLGLYFPDLPNADRITISHLLNHQSGLHDYTKETGFANWMNKPKTQQELLAIIKEKGSDFEPGTREDYCNSNYLVLSYILENITGKTYAENLQTRITSKIGLKNTHLAQAIHPENNESTSYKYSNGNWNAVTETDPSIHAGAGAIVSTTRDLTTFIYALFNGKLIKKSSLEKMTVITRGYGMGIFPYDHNTLKGYGHNGRIEEFYTAVRYFPESKMALAYCTNGINYPRIDILESIVKASFNEPFKVPFQPVSQVNSDLYPGTYVADQMPVVTISSQNDKLVAETQGARFELEPVSENYFMHSLTGYYFEFIPSNNELRIKETDNVYFLKKK